MDDGDSQGLGRVILEFRTGEAGTLSEPQEQRDFTRVHADLAVELTLEDGRTVACRREDLSLNGAMLSSDEDVPSKGRCEIVWTLPAAEPPVRIAAIGESSRSRDDRVAVEFSEVGDESFIYLRKLVLVNAEGPAQVEDELDTSAGTKRQSTDF